MYLDIYNALRRNPLPLHIFQTLTSVVKAQIHAMITLYVLILTDLIPVHVILDTQETDSLALVCISAILRIMTSLAIKYYYEAIILDFASLLQLNCY